MRVYRTEHMELDTGPFRHLPENLCRFPQFRYSSPDYPSLHMDIRSASHNDHCACDSLEQWWHWFGTDDVLEWLKRFGFVCRVYDVPDHYVKLGRKQCAVDLSFADLVEEIPI